MQVSTGLLQVTGWPRPGPRHWHGWQRLAPANGINVLEEPCYCRGRPCPAFGLAGGGHQPCGDRVWAVEPWHHARQLGANVHGAC